MCMDKNLKAMELSLETIKGQVVTQTLDTLNSAAKKKSKNKYSIQGAMSDTYDLSKSVLSAAYEGKGTIIDDKP